MAHHCEWLLVHCMDFRFARITSDWAEKNLGNRNYDVNSLAGAQRNFTDDDSLRVIMGNVEIAVEKHQVRNVCVVAHMDCGAYGGHAAFPDLEAEEERYREDLRIAEYAIRQGYPQIFVRKVLLKFTDPDNGPYEFVDIQ